MLSIIFEQKAPFSQAMVLVSGGWQLHHSRNLIKTLGSSSPSSSSSLPPPTMNQRDPASSLPLDPLRIPPLGALPASELPSLANGPASGTSAAMASRHRGPMATGEPKPNPCSIKKMLECSMMVPCSSHGLTKPFSIPSWAWIPRTKVLLS